MKQSKPVLRSAYLYADGHAVLAYEKRDKDAGMIDYVDIVEKYGPECGFDGGRIIFFHCNYNGYFALAKKASLVSVYLNNASENSKRLGLTINTVQIQLPQGSISINHIVSVMSAPVEYQADTSETWQDIVDKYYWSDMRIRNRIPANKA